MKKVLSATMIMALSFGVYAQGYVNPTKAKKDSCQAEKPCAKCDSLLSQCKTAADSAKVQRYLHSKTIQERTRHNPLVLYGAGKNNKK